MTKASKRSANQHAQFPWGHLAKLSIHDFKSLKAVDVELGQVNVFVGANGSGKSCLLEAVGILGACASGVVDDQALLRRGVRPGVPELYKSSFAQETIAPKISLRVVSCDNVDYHAYITNPHQRLSPQWAFGNEALKRGSQSIASRGPRGWASALNSSFPLENNRSVTAALRARQDTPEEVRQILTVLDDFAIFAPVTPVLRGIAPDTAPRSPVGLYGGQLPEAVGLLLAQESRSPLLAESLGLIDWAETISVGPPSRKFLSASVPTSRFVVYFRDRFMAKNRNRLSGYDASEGALYVLFALVLALSGPRVFAVDNFDQALNPRTARSLTRRFVEHVLQTERQVLLTTHNPQVLDGLALDDQRIRLFTVSRDRKGKTNVRPVPVKDAAGLKARHGEFALSRLWLTGRLGGMPSDV